MLTVRDIKEDDVQAVADLEAETFSDAWSVKSIQETMAQSQAFVLVAESEGKLAGYCIVYFVLDEGEIARIAVDDSFRRRGVGRAILEKTSEVCIEKGIERLLLDVRESNLSAQLFYKDFGFQEDGIRKNFYDAPKEHAVLMSKVVR